MTEQAETRESQMVVVERDDSGKPTVWCDPEVAPLVTALNSAGFRTVASCSGHGKRPAIIALADGREIIIAKDFDEARKIDGLFPGINGEPAAAPAPVERVDQEALRKRFDEIEREICEGKHTAASVFTQMRTAAFYAVPQPAPTAAHDVAGLHLLERIEKHLTNWLELDICECEFGHNCGYNDVIRDRDALRGLIAAHQSGGAK